MKMLALRSRLRRPSLWRRLRAPISSFKACFARPWPSPPALLGAATAFFCSSALIATRHSPSLRPLHSPSLHSHPSPSLHSHPSPPLHSHPSPPPSSLHSSGLLPAHTRTWTSVTVPGSGFVNAFGTGNSSGTGGTNHSARALGSDQSPETGGPIGTDRSARAAGTDQSPETGCPQGSDHLAQAPGTDQAPDTGRSQGTEVPHQNLTPDTDCAQAALPPSELGPLPPSQVESQGGGSFSLGRFNFLRRFFHSSGTSTRRPTQRTRRTVSPTQPAQPTRGMGSGGVEPSADVADAKSAQDAGPGGAKADADVSTAQEPDSIPDSSQPQAAVEAAGADVAGNADVAAGADEEADGRPHWRRQEEFKGTVGFRLGEGCVLVLHMGDITQWAVDGVSDAIVNPANERMLGGGGADGAIHRAAGPRLKEMCKSAREVRPGVRCPTGSAVTTGSGNLPVKRVVHTVGPIYPLVDNPAELLSSAYRSCMDQARVYGVKFIAFPAISCGVYAYPLDEAADVAVRTLQQSCEGIKEVHFILFGVKEYKAWLQVAESLLSPSGV